MSIVNVTNHNPASVLLLEAMVKKAGKNNLLQTFGIESNSGGNVEVQLTVNGENVDFESTVNEMWTRLTTNYETHVLERAKELISCTRLNKLHNLLQDAEWKIEEELIKLQERG